MSFPESLRKTRSRLKVWEILEKNSTPLTARQIAQLVSEADDAAGSGSVSGSGYRSGSDSRSGAVGGKSGNGVWLSSVYRALEAFEEAHVVSRTILKDSPEALYSLSESGHHHYAICLGCKSRTELEGCPFEEEEEHLHTTDEDFMVVGHTVEVFGYCKNCRKKLKNGK